MRKLIIYIISSILLAILTTYLFNTFSTDKISSKLKISSLHPSESMVLQLLNIKFRTDAMEDIVSYFSSKLNNQVYSTENECGKINKINNIVPLVISYSQNQITVEIVSSDENSLSKCKDFIYDQVNNENQRIVRFYSTILEATFTEESTVILSNIKDNTDLNDFIKFYNDLEKVISDNTNINVDTAQSQLLSMLYNDLSKKNDMSVNLNLLEELEYFRVVLDKNSIQKKLNPYFMFISFFVAFFLLLTAVNKIKNNKTVIIRQIDKFLS